MAIFFTPEGINLSANSDNRSVYPQTTMHYINPVPITTSMVADDLIVIGRLYTTQKPTILTLTPSAADATFAFDATLAFADQQTGAINDEVADLLDPDFFATALGVAGLPTTAPSNLQRNDTNRAFRTIRESLRQSYTPGVGAPYTSLKASAFYIVLKVTAAATADFTLNFHGIFYPEPDVTRP